MALSPPFGWSKTTLLPSEASPKTKIPYRPHASVLLALYRIFVWWASYISNVLCVAHLSNYALRNCIQLASVTSQLNFLLNLRISLMALGIYD